MSESFRKRLNDDFPLFVDVVARESFDAFQDGAYVEDVCSFLQYYSKTVRIGPKDHFKSTSLYLFLLWQVWKSRTEGGFGCFYFSYDKTMAFNHLAKVKGLIKSNSWFNDLVDYKPIAEGMMDFAWEGTQEHCTMKPKGMLTFKRGIHEKAILVDDPFQDNANQLDPVISRKISNIFKTQIMDMPLDGGYLHCVLTPQTKDDFCFDANAMMRIKVLSQPAIFLENGKETALWPEHMSLGELYLRRKERGEKIFQQEYLCMPSFSSDTFWKREDVEKMNDPSLVFVHELKTPNIVGAGWDIGKFRHPAHVNIFERVGDIWFQRYHEFMDGWDYTAQVSHMNHLVKAFGIDHAWFDATGREIEGFIEAGTLNRIWKPLIFKTETKWKMVNNMEALRTQNRIKMIPNQRQNNQLLVVNNSLQAMETVEGHGEPFFTMAMALLADYEAKRLPPTKDIGIIQRPRTSFFSSSNSPFGKREIWNPLRKKF